MVVQERGSQTGLANEGVTNNVARLVMAMSCALSTL